MRRRGHGMAVTLRPYPRAWTTTPRTYVEPGRYSRMVNTDRQGMPPTALSPSSGGSEARRARKRSSAESTAPDP